MRLLAFAILVACVQSVCAQSILKDPKELSVLLNEVVVTGTGTEHYLKDAPVQTEVITGKALDSYQGRSMQDILEGLNASITFNPSDMGSGIQMNGLGNDYILILINGKRINGDTGGQNDLSIINPANIERIEIVKGAASSLYGSDAIAGVINIITKKNRDKVSLSNTTRVGSYGDILESVQIGFGHKRVNSTTSLSTTHTDGWRNNGWNRDTNRKPIHELYAKGELNLQSERPAEPLGRWLFLPEMELSSARRIQVLYL